MATQRSIIISEGPSLFEFMLSLFDGDSQNRRYVTFTGNEEGKPSERLAIVIDRSEREGGDGQTWLFGGYFQYSNICNPLKVTGHYSTKTRKGWIKTVN